MASFDDMPTLRASAPSSPPSSGRHLRKSYARRAERCCCQAFSFIPLCFVYGLTTWAVWVACSIAFFAYKSGPAAYVKAAVAIALYLLADTSYSVSVFTRPGSPAEERRDLGRSHGPGGRGAYEGLPTHEPRDEGAGIEPLPPMTTVTAKSSGRPRFCKKCNCIKPDRTHHCSTCGTCVMKMDHHCPWLATCVGLRNYKAFLLFLIYTSLFCWYCFTLAGLWVWSEIVHESQMEEGLRIVNFILLAVIGGIIGLVLSGFTGWHIYLTLTGQTTIESLEKTRYLSPLKESMEQQLNSNRTWLADEDDNGRGQSIGDRLKEIHANALPGVSRPEEGESTLRTPNNRSPAPPQTGSPARDQLQRSYAEMEAQRERDRYTAYLDEQDSEMLPNAFNLGWKRNALHVFGHAPLLWFFPVCNTTGDGWQWEISPAWLAAREDVARQREARDRQAHFSGPTRQPPPDFRWQPGQGFVRPADPVPPPPRANGLVDSREMQPLDRRKGADDYDTSSDEERPRVRAPTANWNDVPEEFLNTSRSKDTARSTSQGRLGKGKGD